MLLWNDQLHHSQPVLPRKCGNLALTLSFGGKEEPAKLCSSSHIFLVPDKTWITLALSILADFSLLKGNFDFLLLFQQPGVGPGHGSPGHGFI